MPFRRARPAAPDWSAGRGHRFPTRWINAIIDHAPPPGTGVAAATLLLLASVGYGVVRGQHTAAIAATVQTVCDEAANVVGFGISEVAISGAHNVSREELLASAGITGQTSLLFLNAAQTRARLMTNPWVADAAVLKLYPARLRIEIKERKPFALWQKDYIVSVIATDGTVLASPVPRRFASLPLVVGKGAQYAAGGFLAKLAHYPEIARAVTASVLVADRRWNLYLKDGIEVQLPEFQSGRALRLLVDLDRSKHLLTRDIAKVDLRLPDRVTVRLSDEAAAARDAALKAAADKEKKKRKGGEA
jgi:cell division protein FtsQ